MKTSDANLPPGFKTLCTIATIPAGARQRFEILHQSGALGDDFVAIEFCHAQHDGGWRNVRGVRIGADQLREVADTLTWAADRIAAAR